jgi:hypothetical protein
MSGKSKLAIAAAAALVALPAAVVLAQGIGADGNPGQSAVPGIASAAAHQVSGAAAKAPAAAGRGARARTSLQYFLTTPQTVPPGRSGLRVGPLPKTCHPISGYYFIHHQLSTRVISEGDSPYGKRRWAFYRNNATGKPVRNVTYGVVCLRGVKVVH